jgi:hypothetical protein
MIFLSVAGGKATAQGPANLPKLEAPRFVASYPRPPVMSVSLSSEVDARAQIAACAHISALRGASARSSGADYATQNRVLELTFLLCMSGKPATN